MKRNLVQGQDKPAELGQVEGNMDMGRKDYMSEYKHRFRHFSQYEYVDGRFLLRNLPPAEDTGAWYKELVELRQRAGVYKCRGLCSEVSSFPDYHRHIWEQVSNRSTLAALGLIPVSPRSSMLPRDISARMERGCLRRDVGSGGRTGSKEPLSVADQFKVEVAEGRMWTKVGGTPHKGTALKLRGRSQSAEPRRGGPPSLAGSSPLSGKTSNGGYKAALRKTHHQPPPAPLQNKFSRPTSLSTGDTPGSTTSEGSRDPSIKRAVRQHFVKDSAMVDLVDNSDGTVIKSPPEPTRVKFPEQVNTRSPDSVKWTVPLDKALYFKVATHEN